MLRRSCALALALLTLSACDSGEPDGSDALLGTWTLTRSTADTYVTVNRALSLVDRERAPTGAIQITGAQTGTLRFMDVTPGNTYQVDLTSYDPATRAPTERVEALLTADAAVVTVYDASGLATQYTATVYGSPTPFTYENGRLTVRPAVLQSRAGAVIEIAGGALAFQRKDVAPGVRTLMRRQINTLRDPVNPRSAAIRYVFEEGEAFHSEEGDPPNAAFEFGRWAVTGPQVSIVVEYGMLPSRKYLYEVTSGTLLLRALTFGCAGSDDECLRHREQTLDVPAGSVTTVEDEVAETFSRGTARRGAGA